MMVVDLKVAQMGYASDVQKQNEKKKQNTTNYKKLRKKIEKRIITTKWGCNLILTDWL